MGSDLNIKYSRDEFRWSTSDERFQAALYDYVGAVYGDENQVEFDGELTLDEKEYVETTFGEYIPRSGAVAYLTEAKRIFFESINTTPVQDDYDVRCNKFADQFDTINYSNPVFGSAYLLMGAHSCGETFGKMYSKIELEIASDSDNWLFFIEGSKATDLIKASSPKESFLLQHIANRLGINVEDAVAQPYDKMILEALQREYGYTAFDVAMLSCATSSIERFKKESAQTQEKQFAIIDKQAKGMAKLFSQDKDEIVKRVKDFLKQGPGSVQPKIKKFVEDYKTVSNQLSPEKVKGILKEQDNKHALCQFGAAHRDITDAVYAK